MQAESELGMAQIDTIRTDEDIKTIGQALGENYIEGQLYDDLRKAQLLDAQRAANTALLAQFDTFCTTRGINYFIFGETLSGAMAYADYIPGHSDLYIGMLRPEYDRFLKAYSASNDANSQGWRHSSAIQRKDLQDVDDIRPHIISEHTNAVTDGDGFVYGPDSLPLVVRGHFTISIFELAPDDFFTRKRFFRQMGRRSDALHAALDKRGLLDGDYAASFNLEESLKRAKPLPLKLASKLTQSCAKKYRDRPMKMAVVVAGARSTLVPVQDIASVRRVEFAGITVNVPIRTAAWPCTPVKETSPELKRLQDCAKEIVVEIDRVCELLGIQYFACGGTMLGHVRHDGFIPWDDDIDVGMLRADYERFKAEAGALLDTERFFLQTRESDPEIPYLFSKVRMNNSSYITDYNHYRNYHKGICVDIFPFDYIPNDAPSQRRFADSVTACAKRHNRIVNRQYPKAQYETKTDRKDLDWLMGQVVGRLLVRRYGSKDLSETQRSYDKKATTYDAKASELGLEYVASFVPTYTMARVDELLPVQRVDFEGIKINLPRNPERFLTMQYGNFMIEPYLHQRMGHELLLFSDDTGVTGGMETE